uniref:Uncharacterized protein n=1 Tax=Catharus ustulatus TaxID=91951 RepID=A0A8C3TNI4_CATUS
MDTELSHTLPSPPQPAPRRFQRVPVVHATALGCPDSLFRISDRDLQPLTLRTGRERGVPRSFCGIGEGPAERGPGAAFHMFVLMEDLLDKLKLLSYEEEPALEPLVQFLLGPHISIWCGPNQIRLSLKAQSM